MHWIFCSLWNNSPWEVVSCPKRVEVRAAVTTWPRVRGSRLGVGVGAGRHSWKAGTKGKIKHISWSLTTLTSMYTTWRWPQNNSKRHPCLPVDMKVIVLWWSRVNASQRITVIRTDKLRSYFMEQLSDSKFRDTVCFFYQDSVRLIITWCKPHSFCCCWYLLSKRK